MVKKKNPSPGILDWIRDTIYWWIVGYREDFEKALNARIRASVEEPKKEDADKQVKSVLTAALAFEGQGKPVTPEEAAKHALSEAAKIQESHVKACIAMVAAELGSLGQIDYTLTEFMDLPWIQAQRNMARSAWETEFTYGYDPLFRRYWLRKYLPMLPPVPDLITMVVREVIKPEKFRELMPDHGYSSEIADWYWENHWILLPLGEVKDARHRGHIGDEELGKFLVLHDYKPEARPGIGTSDRDLAAKLIWDLPGAIEARWMFRWGKTDRDGLKDLLIKGGLDPAYADAVADAVATNQFLREIRMQETNIKTDLRDGYIAEATARADLKEIGYPPEFVEYHIADALKDRERSHKKELLTHYRDCFLADIPTTPPFEDAVRGILVVKEAADLFIERAYVKKLGKRKAD